MPLISDAVASDTKDFPIYFKTLRELDDWLSGARAPIKLDGLLRYAPRKKLKGAVHESHGRLMVSHDYKGGYTEGPSSLSYTYNFWNLCDTFVYFSHHRVTIPPPGWINAAHRQGVKMLGVLMFEHDESAEDCLRLLYGKLPDHPASIPGPFPVEALPISAHYAHLLVETAHQRGFDGYLLNVETKLTSSSEQARALMAWISLLKHELKTKIGNHAQVIWYDSVTSRGEIRYQNRLSSRNLPFFLSSDALFTNYWWSSSYPLKTLGYFFELDPEVFLDSPKSINDIFFGADVWGRSTHGGGGLATCRALDHIEPKALGLSVALFAPGWTWESQEGEKGWGWSKWWELERTLWIGPEDPETKIDLPTVITDPREDLPCAHGPFRPISDYFTSLPPPVPEELPFYTSFCPGIGYSWFIEGKKVMQKDSGWTDIDKQTSLGDLLWPRPRIAWEGDAVGESPRASTSLVFTDAFNGGSCAAVNISGPYSRGIHSFSFPVQSIALSPKGTYTFYLTYKAIANEGVHDVTLSIRGELEKLNLVVEPITDAHKGELENGWKRLAVTCKVPDDPGPALLCSIVVSDTIANSDPTLPLTMSLQLGEICVFRSSYLCDMTKFQTRVLWAECITTTRPVDGTSTSTLTLTWEPCITFAEPADVDDESYEVETARPPWKIDYSMHWYPRFLYFNIYVQKMKQPQTQQQQDPSDASQLKSETAFPERFRTSDISPDIDSGERRFIGTSNIDGRLCHFPVDCASLPADLRGGSVRFIIQPVTDRGEVSPWEQCAVVEHILS